MAKGHRSQIKRDRNENKEIQDHLQSYLMQEFLFRKPVSFLDAIRGKDVETALGILTYNPRYASSVIENY